MAGPPGFFAPDGRREAVGQAVERLEDVIHGDAAGVLGADLGAEDFLEVAPDDEHHAAEPGAEGVVHRVVEDGFAGGADGIDLLEAAVARTHAGGEDEKRGMHRQRGEANRRGRSMAHDVRSERSGTTQREVPCR